MERLLSDALTRADFGKDVTDRDVLKSLLKGLTATQAATMARMPRERLLSTVAAHRESHRVAHEALARLGTVLEQLGTTKLSDLTNATTPDDTAAAAAGGEEEAAAEKVEVDVGGKAEKFVDPEAGDDEVVEEEDAEDAAEFGVEAAVSKKRVNEPRRKGGASSDGRASAPPPFRATPMSRHAAWSRRPFSRSGERLVNGCEVLAASKAHTCSSVCETHEIVCSRRSSPTVKPSE